MCKTDEAAEKFRKKSYGGKKGLGTATQEETKRRKEVDVATTTQEENETREEVDDNVATIESGDVCETEVHGGQTKSLDEVVAEAGDFLVVYFGYW